MYFSFYHFNYLFALVLTLFAAPDYKPTLGEIDAYIKACVPYRTNRIIAIRKEQRTSGHDATRAAELADELKYLSDKENLPFAPLANLNVGSIGTVPESAHATIKSVENGEITAEYKTDAPPSGSAHMMSPDGYANSTLSQSLSTPEKITKTFRISGISTKGLLAGRSVPTDSLLYVAGSTQGYDAMPLLVPIKNQTPLVDAWKKAMHIK